MSESEYLVIYEADEDGWSAYSPDLPGCVAAADTKDELEGLMAEAIPFHLEGLRHAGLQVPQPSSRAGYVPA